DYVVDKYGKHQVAQIVTFGTMGPKTGIRDVARVLGLPLPEANRIAKMVPEIPGTTFKQAFEQVAELSSLRKSQDALVRQTISIAEKLEGITRHHGIHASAVIIAPSDIRELVPVMNVREKFLKKDDKQNDSAEESSSTPLEDLLVTQFEGK